MRRIAFTLAERRALPGDDLIPAADLQATRAITVHAPADGVWPWIAQMGQGRGGLYSYDALENLVGCDMHSADRIVAEWQDVAVGDPLRLHPEVALEVALVEPGRALVVRGAVPMGEVAPPRHPRPRRGPARSRAEVVPLRLSHMGDRPPTDASGSPSTLPAGLNR